MLAGSVCKWDFFNDFSIGDGSYQKLLKDIEILTRHLLAVNGTGAIEPVATGHIADGDAQAQTEKRV
jgi:hypothetical protein